MARVKSKKEHRKRVQKRNEEIKMAQRRYQKFINEQIKMFKEQQNSSNYVNSVENNPLNNTFNLPSVDVNNSETPIDLGFGNIELGKV